MAKNLPIFWSFRRCPYAMRARLAVRSAGIKVELREILLRDKPSAFLAASATKTVPVLELDDCPHTCSSVFTVQVPHVRIHVPYSFERAGIQRLH